MKFSAIFLLAACLQVSAGGYSQKVTLSVKNATLKQVFNQIERQTGFSLLWDKELRKTTQPISLNVKEASIEEAMDACLKNQPLTYNIINNLIVVKAKPASVVPIAENKQSLPPPPVVITGTVVSSEGTPLTGAAVSVKGTSIGTTTDASGKFSLKVPGIKGVLVISFVGYASQEISFSKADDFRVVLLAAVTKVEEVVVVGYGTQKKVNATGAVVQIDSKILEDRPISRLSQGLQGAVANLNILTGYGGGAPNATQSINIRGYTGFGSSGSPLTVIDGVQGGDINAINPNDVESITVVKDAAASAIYGSSAPYGVLLITTKKGKAGKTTITYNNSFTVNKPIGMPKMLNSLDFADIYNEAAINAGQGPFYYFSQDLIQKMKDYQAGKIKTETSASPNPADDSWASWFGANANND